MKRTTSSPNNLSQQFINFLQNSPTPFHATKNLESLLQENGFIKLDESKRWESFEKKKILYNKKRFIFGGL